LKNFSPHISILFLLLLIHISCNYNYEIKHNVTFRVEVKNRAEDQNVFITGNQPELGTWNPGKVVLERINDSLFTKTISFKEGTNLEFKITGGSWWREALDKNEFLYNSRKLSVEQDTIISITVYDWKNTFLNGEVVLNQKRFHPNRTIMGLDDFWKYHPGDNPTWAKEDFDDKNWPTTNTYINWQDSSILKWENIGWFRFHFVADTSLWNKSIALLIGQLGSSQIYYNGRLLYTFGEIGNSPESFKPSQVRVWKELQIDPRPEQVFAVRYANYNWKEQRELRFSPGFLINLKDINTTFQQIPQNVRNASYHQMIFTLIPLILFFLHVFIYVFNPKQKENLFYAISLLGFAGITYFSFERFIETDPALIILNYKLNGVSVPVAIFFGLMTSYAMTYVKIPKRWNLYFILFIFISLANYYLMEKVSTINYIFFGVTAIDIFISSFIRKGKKDLKGDWIVVTGLIILFFFIVIQILLDFSIISPITEYNQVFVYGMIGFALSMSLFLSYNLSMINKDLKTQLIKVKELSEKTIEQEREANRLELEKRIIDADNNRKTKELEDARQLQLSLLPKEIPKSENLDIAFYMSTAAEVGGDYYDIITDGDGRITIAVGDATGHGVKAGILVAIVKGLIHELIPEFSSAETLEKINNLLKSMQLGNLYMGLTLLKINNLCINISSAGMPPALLFRKNENRLDEIIIKRLPLGATNKLNFEEQIIKINAGDVLLLLSDGLSELFDENRDMFEYCRIKEVFLKNINKCSSEIISELKIAAEKWRNGSEQMDDMTFVAIKCKQLN
jgi:serine phosphatase RsbU (regulator of sigma subunit)